MSKSTDTVYRQWRVLELLPAPPASITVAEIWTRLQSENLRCTRRTVERDLEALSARNPIITDESTKPFRWSWAPGITTRLIPGLTPAQAIALSLARRHLDQMLPMTFADSLGSLYRAADACVESLGWHRWTEATAFVTPSQVLKPAPCLPEVMDAIQCAIAGDRQLQIRYRKKWDEQAQWRTVNPLGVVFGSPVSYLVATDPDDDLPKQFALHRIIETQRQAVARRVPRDFALSEFVSSSASRFLHQRAIRLVLWMDPPAAEHLKETPLSDDQTWTRLSSPDVVEVTATVDDTEQLRWWIQSFANQIEVRQPTRELSGHINRGAIDWSA